MAWNTQTVADCAVIAQTVVLAIAAYAACRYAKEASRHREVVEQQTKRFSEGQFIDALVHVHQCIQSPESHQARRFLYESFNNKSVNNWLWLAASKTPHLKDYVTKNKEGLTGIDVLKLLQGLQSSGATLRQFTDNLRSRDERGVSPLDQFERVVTDFDIIAIPYLQGVQVMEKVATSYKDILESTAEMILPFVAIERQLRGGPYIYRERYLRLLQKLGIDTKDGWVTAILDRKTLPDASSN